MTDRRIRRPSPDDLRPLLRLAPVWLAGSAVLAGLLGRRIPSEQLLLDPSTYGGHPWYLGLVSNLGVLGWTAAATAAGFGAWLGRVGGRERAGQLLGGGALLSVLLALDDLFQLHIVVADTLGLPKVAFYGLYLALLVWWLGANATELLRTPALLLGAAVAALGASATFDRYGGGAPGWVLVEDAGKFLGILAWALYFFETTAALARSLLTAGPASPQREPVGEPVATIRG